jgi:2-polyprenyl-3-methyl-5-hydroxy-6-metoxy-1,4-benzoquinol methylase
MTSTLEKVEEAQPSVNEILLDLHPAVLCPTCGGGRCALYLTAPDRFHGRKQLYNLLRCSSCHTVWLDQPPVPTEMGAHYTEDYHRAIMLAGEGSAAERWKDQVKRIARYKSGGQLLDVGCSSGGFLSTMVGPAWHLHGIEMEESTAQRARANCGAEVFVGDALAAPYPPNSFDVVTCFDVLEHVYSPREFLTKIYEWLKPGGIYYAMSPNIASWEARCFGTHWFGLELPRHITHFSPRSLRYLLSEVGFEEVSLQTPAVSYYVRSADYVRCSLLQKLGFHPAPQAKAQPPGLARKAVRKAFRMATSPLVQGAALAGAGPCLEAVFRKPGGGKH